MKEIETLSGLIKTRLDDLKSEISEKYKFLKVNRSKDTALFEEDGSITKSKDITMKYSMTIIYKDKVIGNINYDNPGIYITRGHEKCCCHSHA